MLSPNLERTLRQAIDFANERRHEYATLEHLLLALCDDDDAVIQAGGATMAYNLSHLLDPSGKFRDKNAVGSSRDAGERGNPAGVPSHDFANHYPMVRFRRRTQAVETRIQK